jgi:hypothetical protein
MTRALLAFALALVPASAGAVATAPSKPLALTAAPARLLLQGSGSDTVRVRNPGTKRIAVDVASTGFALDLRGRPRIAAPRAGRSAARWLTVRPRHFTLGPRGQARLRVSARVRPRAEPGDHGALVLLSARPLASARVSVRLRLGVVVVVRAPGTVVRHLKLGTLRLARRSGRRALELMVVNAGNVTERLIHVRAVLSRLPPRSRIATGAAGTRELLPRTRGLLELRLHTRAHGPVTARVVVLAGPGRPAIRRTYRVRI